MGFNDDAQSNNFNLQEVYENKRVEHQRNMQDKEDEMRQVGLDIGQLFEQTFRLLLRESRRRKTS